MLDSKRYLYVGFLCHLVVEKSLKAYFQHLRRIDPPPIHNLKTLAERSGLVGRLSPEQKRLLNVLEPLNIRARYPDYKRAILQRMTHEFCVDVLEKTKEFHEWIVRQLST